MQFTIPLPRLGLLLGLGLWLVACTTVTQIPPPVAKAADVKPAIDSISADDIMRHVQVLASDEFEGRAPGTRGEELTVAYLATEFNRLGLQPGNPDGTFVQKVPLIGHSSSPSASVAVGGGTMNLRFPDDFVAWSFRREKKEVKIENSELVFVGYGVTAPEYDWDDYKAADLRGKTLVMLINDPQVPDPRDPARLDDTMFKGAAMTYYGRWTYKYEMAAKLGAASAIIVHETVPAAYPYAVVVNSWARENFAIKTAAPNADFPAVPAWMPLDRAKQIFAAAGHDFDTLKKAALRKDFKPVPLGATLNMKVKNTWREIDSRNVVAKIEGTDPRLKDEYVIYTAHWDHFGRDEKLPGDKIYHGALDNASGVAALLGLAKMFKALPQPPRRSILFIATTGEEQGLLGAKFYAAHPLYPLERSLANINMDGMNPWGRTRDIEIIGFGNSTLDDLVADAVSVQGRIVKPDSRADLGFFYRADHFEFAKAGVPAVYTKRGNDFIGKPAEYGMAKTDEYIAHDYHKVTDTVRPEWNWSGAVEDIEVLFRVGYGVAQGLGYPAWRAGAEFAAKRDAQLKKGEVR